MGSGTSTTEDEGHLDETHEESERFFFLPTCDVLLFILLNSHCIWDQETPVKDLGIPLKALLKTERPPLSHTVN